MIQAYARAALEAQNRHSLSLHEIADIVMHQTTNQIDETTWKRDEFIETRIQLRVLVDCVMNALDDEMAARLEHPNHDHYDDDVRPTKRLKSEHGERLTTMLQSNVIDTPSPRRSPSSTSSSSYMELLTHLRRLHESVDSIIHSFSSTDDLGIKIGRGDEEMVLTDDDGKKYEQYLREVNEWLNGG